MRGLSCFYCGGSGIKPNGEKCSCVNSNSVIDTSGLYFLPKVFQNLEFVKEFCKNEKIYETFKALQQSKEFLQQVVFIYGEPGTSKVAFAYALLNECYQKNYSVLPVLNILELKSAMNSKYQYTKNYEIGLSDVANSDFLCVKIDSPPSSYVLSELVNLIGLRRNRQKGLLIMSSISLKDLALIEKGTKLFKGEGFDAKRYFLS